MESKSPELTEEDPPLPESPVLPDVPMSVPRCILLLEQLSLASVQLIRYRVVLMSGDPCPTTNLKFLRIPLNQQRLIMPCLTARLLQKRR